jgi:hypothetical protein
MKQKDRYLIMIFLVVLIMDFAVGFIRRIPIVVPPSMDYFYIYYLIIYISFLISPVLVFIAFYLIGRKFDVRTNLRSLIIILLTGAYLGDFLSTIIYIPLREYVFSWESVIGIFISLQFLYTFFTAFSALTIAYFRNND